MDRVDRRILDHLQTDSAVPVAELAERVGLSKTPCWRRIKAMQDTGLIRGQVALLDRAHLNLGVTAFVSIRTSDHSQAWLDGFAKAVRDLAEVTEIYRMAGDVDYLLKVVVPDIPAYDRFYKRLIGRIPLTDVSTAFAMEEIKHTTALPLDYA